MSPLRLNGSTSGYSQLDAPAIAGDQTFTLPGTGGTIDRLNRAGNILQVVNGTTSTQVTTSTSTYVDTTLTATITPISASSKILVLINQSGCYKTNNNTWIRLRLLQGSTQLIIFEAEAGFNNTSNQQNIGACSCTYVDSPATTSATTYKTQINSANNLAAVFTQTSNSVSTITLLEVAA